MRARKQRDQIVAAMAHCKVNVWAVSKEPRKLTMLEGSFIHNGQTVHSAVKLDESQDLSCLSWDHVSNRRAIDQAIEDVLEGRKESAEVESEIAGNWHRVISFDNFLSGLLLTISGSDHPRIRRC